MQNLSADWRRLEQEFQKAQSLRAFHYSSLKTPENGGYFYALSSLSICRGLPKTATGDFSEQRLKAYNELKYRCDFTESDMETAHRQLEAARNFKFADDPLFKQTFDYLAAKTRKQRMNVLAVAIETGHPDVITSLVYPLLEESAFQMIEKNQPPPGYLKFAPALIACDLGADCGVNSTRALELCAHTGWCGSSVREELQNGLNIDFPKLEAMVNPVLSNIRRRNLDALTSNR
jgi:hypothetical protein